MKKFTEQDLDAQIENTEKEIAIFSQKLFGAKGVLGYLTFMKENFRFDKEDSSAPSSPA